PNVDKFVAGEAPAFNKLQQQPRARPQTVQSKASKFRTFSTNFNKLRNLFRDQEVGGSNPLAPIFFSISIRHYRAALLLGRQPPAPPVIALGCTRKTNARREGNMSFHLSAAGRKAGKDQPVFLFLRVILGVELRWLRAFLAGNGWHCEI